MRIKVVFASLLVLLLLSAFVLQPAPLFAVALPEGRTLDEGHDSGYIDWSGGVSYINLNHRDGLCPSNCVEQVTRISNGGTASGAFAAVDVSYFEAMVAFTHNSGAGTAVLNACGSSATWNLYTGPGSGLPGFVSMSIAVPSGCTSWSLSASGGYVDFRSVDANYVSPPPPVSTNTFIPVPTETFTSLPIDTETAAPTATDTLVPVVTPSDTPISVDTPSPISTNTSTQTLPPGVTPSDTPVPPVSTNTSAPISSSNGGGQGGSPPVVPFVPVAPLSTSPQIQPILIIPTSVVVRTSTPQSFSVVALPSSLPVCGAPPSSTANASGNSSEFPWWLFPAGLSVASVLSLLNSFLKQSDGKVASLTSSGVSVPVPKVVWRTTTVGEWVTRPIRTLVQITRTIWRTITEAVPRFVQRIRQIIEYITHSGWVKSVVQVAQTVYQWVAEKVPLLSWIGWIIGFIWKNVLKPFVTWVAKTIYTLKTWIEKIVRQVVEWVQDGWNYITRQVSETIREWVEKTDWVRTWVTKEITVPEIVWETKFIPLPSLSLSSILTTDLIRNLAKLLPTLGLAAISITMCANPSLPTTLTATPDVMATAMCYAWETQTAVSATQTAMAVTPTPIPTATAIPVPYTVTVQSGDSLSYFASLFGLKNKRLC